MSYVHRYVPYPRGELIDTIFLSDVSPTWRSIEHGLQLLKHGIIWRMRSGTKTQIWCDSWIPQMPSLKLSLKKARTHLRWVSQLMKVGRFEWDEQVIRACMYPHDAKEVLKIRLPQQGGDDILAWHYERIRLFTVRSAYRLVLNKEQANRG
jgi:hypothetical protein